MADFRPRLTNANQSERRMDRSKRAQIRLKLGLRLGAKELSTKRDQ